MPLNHRPAAMTAAVLAFFATSVIGVFCDNSPYTCCKRALIVMAAAYIVTTVTVRILNIVLIDAIIAQQVDKKLAKQKDKGQR